jgi:hypothetical protein
MLKLSGESRKPVSTPWHDLSLVHSQEFCVEQRFLLDRFKCDQNGYHLDLCCMEDTRKSLIDKIIAWVTDGSTQTDGRNIYWIYGLPGIGKTSLAHSTCAILHDQELLVGAFFCRRGDPELSGPRNIISTLIHNFAIILPPFRSIVAQRLREDPNLTPASMKYTFFLDSIGTLPRIPKKTLVFVIDALDGCGSAQSRQDF